MVNLTNTETWVIKSKLAYILKDNQKVFKDLSDPLYEMAEQGVQKILFQVPADGNWFKISFDAIEVKKDRLVISAERTVNGITPTQYDPAEMQYVVEFRGTRAAYLRG